ncbi:MAG TPA: mevalonate kinase [Patescibacteria group bacterium]|nr:mevalonate kinase [Patescibacteria group bacterium]
MNKKITISAPGKLMLFGEHAVVYDRPCLVTAVDQRMRATVEVLDSHDFILDAPDVKISNYKKSINTIGKGEIPKGAMFIEIAVKNFKTRYGLKKGIRITTQSEFSSQFGFGSSSASTVCTLKALSELLGKKLSNKQLFDLAYKTVLDIQGKGSGFDVAAAVYGGTLYFVTGGKTIKPLQIKKLPLLVGYSGVKADTVTLMNQVKATSEKYPKVITGIYNEIAKLIPLAQNALLKNDWETSGELMNINQGYLAALGVSTQKLEDIIYAIRDNGGYGAKLSGAGGGDCIIGLAPESKIVAIKKTVKSVGGEFLDVAMNAEGVRIDPTSLKLRGARK